MYIYVYIYISIHTPGITWLEAEHAYNLNCGFLSGQVHRRNAHLPVNVEDVVLNLEATEFDDSR